VNLAAIGVGPFLDRLADEFEGLVLLIGADAELVLRGCGERELERRLDILLVRGRRVRGLLRRSGDRGDQRAERNECDQ
jgi:hypothetical protein